MQILIANVKANDWMDVIKVIGEIWKSHLCDNNSLECRNFARINLKMRIEICEKNYALSINKK